MAVVKFSKQFIQPNPKEVDYWVDIASNPYGAIIKYYNGEDWEQLNGSGGSASDFDFYTKTQINQMLAKKADIASVESKVDDAELSELIKKIEFVEIGPSDIQLIYLNYDDSKVAVTLPVADSASAGIVTAEDFKNFVKQYQLQDLYIEMYDTFEDIRARYQLKLTAGNNIVIDKINNTIGVVEDLKVDWDRVRSKPDFHEVAVSGDYWDLENHLTSGIGIEIDEANKINAVPDIELYKIVDVLPSTDIDTSKIYILLIQNDGYNNVYAEYIYDEEEGWKQLRTFKANIDLKNLLSKEEAEATYVTKELFNNTTEEIESNVDYAVDAAIEFSQVAADAKIAADAARAAVATLEGLADADTSAVTAASVIT